ncbi:uncharacterized protein LOC120260093 [Dioscorea cayenensis subsp. rotundata]|uniref:Uncharacterized protein LOC120260093 n=1 Tax=Dioscorea cayennensis subsp. rotundata TaxID=55577 RepID=A0AB40B898_DIOCR|nr:uncharacterized protein LOC120260093 [Dioscorea cayenensis subsp. rotundata]
MAKSSTTSQTHVPIFKSETFNLWIFKMKTMFRSKGLWPLVEKGFSEEGAEAQMEEIRKQDLDALYLIQQGLDERILIRIAEAETAKQAWDILKTEYQANTKILSVKLYSLRQELETTKMKSGEKIQDFISRVLDVVYQIRVLGEDVPESTMVGKILRRKEEETAFQVVTNSLAETSLRGGRGNVHGPFREHFRGRGRGEETKNEETEGLLFMVNGSEEASQQTVRLGDGKILKVGGIGDVLLHSNTGKINITIACIRMTAHKMFPLDGGDIGSAQMVLGETKESKLWH